MRPRLPLPDRPGAGARRGRRWSWPWCRRGGQPLVPPGPGPGGDGPHPGGGGRHRRRVQDRLRWLPDGSRPRVGPELGIDWSLGVDGISLFLLLMTAVLFPLTLLGAPGERDPRSFVAWVLLLEAACMGSFVSLDLILFFLFFELTLVPAYFLIGRLGLRPARLRGDQFFIYTFTGSAFLLVGIVAVAFIHQSQTGVLTFALPALGPHPSVRHRGRAAVPGLHGRLRGQGPHLPLPHLVARRLRRGPHGRFGAAGRGDGQARTYGIIRFDLNLFPQASPHLAPLLLTLAVIGILYGAVVACAQRDLKRLLAYSSLAQIGLHRARHVRPQQPGTERRRAPDGQPRPGHRHPVHPGRVDLRAAQDLADRPG